MVEKPNLNAGSKPVDLQGLPDGETPFRWEPAGGAFELGGDSPGAFRDVSIEGALTRDGDVVRVRGVLRGVLESECDRCLSRFDLPIETSIELRVVFGGSESRPRAPQGESLGDAQDEGVETVVLAPEATLDWEQAAREAVFLERPIKTVCRDDCRGLCPACGANRNLETCACDPTPRDSRWSALRGISFPSDVQE